MFGQMPMMFEGIKITDWIVAISAVATAITSVVMASLAYKEFIKAPEQDETPTGSNTPQAPAATPTTEITMFKTSKQTTVLRVVDNTLQCEIIDTRPGKGGIQWSFPPDLCHKILDQKLVRANPHYKQRTGLVNIGPKTNWLYSKALYWDHTILENDIYALLETVPRA